MQSLGYHLSLQRSMLSLQCNLSLKRKNVIVVVDMCLSMSKFTLPRTLQLAPYTCLRQRASAYQRWHSTDCRHQLLIASIDLPRVTLMKYQKVNVEKN